MRPSFHQDGLTLIELMIAMALGLLIMLTATGLLLSSKAAYISQNQIATVQESGRYAVQIISRAIRQSSYPPINKTAMLVPLPSEVAASIDGRDSMTLKKSAAGLQSSTSAGAVNGSDILALGYFGDDIDGKGNGSMLNCAGIVTPALTEDEALEAQRSWSIFFVAKDGEGEPELRCKYKTANGWNADAIVRGVESLQVLYGIDASGNGIPDYFINANTVDILDERLALEGNNAVERALNLQRNSYWKKVRAIKFSLLVRGSESARNDALVDMYDLFGAEYSALFSAADKGVQIDEKKLPQKERNRIRKIFSNTVHLRNDTSGEIK
tara:strand:- start:459965 stop:460942 length:978 start_codon:yes stop_codon:yes gene_type:complete